MAVCWIAAGCANAAGKRSWLALPAIGSSKANEMLFCVAIWQ
jgi:hypothetical protein